jgi:hypothetical protein
VKTLEILHDHSAGSVVFPKPTSSQPTRAWQLIEEPRNWLQNHEERVFVDHVERCPIGAMRVIYPNSEDFGRAVERLKLHIGPFRSVPDWNDAKERSHGSVLSTMKFADV